MDNPLLNILSVPEKLSDKFFWATVTATSPLRVQEDTALTPIGTTPKTLVPCVQGDRVFCVRTGRRLIVLGKMDGGTPENSLYIGGRWWQASGTAPMPSYSWKISNINGWWGAIITIPPPFPPPAGYTFHWSIATTNGYTILINAATTASGHVTGHLMSFLAASPVSLSLRWQLVKK